jgi:hypothetical protein
METDKEKVEKLEAKIKSLKSVLFTCYEEIVRLRVIVEDFYIIANIDLKEFPDREKGQIKEFRNILLEAQKEGSNVNLEDLMDIINGRDEIDEGKFWQAFDPDC